MGHISQGKITVISEGREGGGAILRCSFGLQLAGPLAGGVGCTRSSK